MFHDNYYLFWKVLRHQHQHIQISASGTVEKYAYFVGLLLGYHHMCVVTPLVKKLIRRN